jgi:hypothetical protein
MRLFIIQNGIEDIDDLMMYSIEDLRDAVVYRPKDVTGGADFDAEDFYTEGDRKKDKEAGIAVHELNKWNAFLSFLEIHRDGTPLLISTPIVSPTISSPIATGSKTRTVIGCDTRH